MIWKDVVRYSVSVAVLFGLWQLLILVFKIPPYILPGPGHVIVTLFREYPSFIDHTKATLFNMIVGAGAGISLGIMVGLSIAYSRILLWLLEPYLVIFQSFPREALIPVVIVWLGFGHAPKIFNSAVLSFFPMAIITMNGLLDTRTEYLELVRNWGMSKWEEFIYCRLPYAIQSIVGGLKIAVPLGLIGAVLGEFMGGSEGLGYVIVSSGANYRMDRSFASLMILSLIGITSLGSVRFLQDIILKNFKQE